MRPFRFSRIIWNYSDLCVQTFYFIQYYSLLVNKKNELCQILTVKGYRTYTNSIHYFNKNMKCVKILHKQTNIFSIHIFELYLS